MKRDMELVRELLLAIEASTHDPATWMTNVLPAQDPKWVSYHTLLLHEAGLIDAKDLTKLAGLDWKPKRLTYRGHEFLDDIRDQGIWQKTKERAKGVTSVGVSFLWEIAKAEIKAKLGL